MATKKLKNAVFVGNLSDFVFYFQDSPPQMLFHWFAMSVFWKAPLGRESAASMAGFRVTSERSDLPGRLQRPLHQWL